MHSSNLTRTHSPESLSRATGAAQGGSAKTKAERERLDRKHDVEPEPNPLAKRELPDTTTGANEQRTPDAQPPSQRRE